MITGRDVVFFAVCAAVLAVAIGAPVLHSWLRSRVDPESRTDVEV